MHRRFGIELLLLTLLVALLPGGTSRAASSDDWIVAGDQGSNQLLAFDPAATDWNSSSAVIWSWRPTSALGFSSAEITGFGLVSDFKLRGSRFVVAASDGLAAIVSYPSGTRQWAKVISGNLHSVELLPNGNIAVAASTGGWVRVYASSQGASASTFAQYNLTDAHATLWDPTTQRLWVIGVDTSTSTPVLTALIVGGSAASPTLREDTARHVTLPTRGGHDVSADPNDPDLLWVSTGSAVYQYDKVTRTFRAPSAGGRDAVKSITSQPSGQLVETRPDAVKSPVGNCTADDWCTDTVDLFNPTATRTRTGAAFYKARVWNPHYNAAGDTPHGPVSDRVRNADGSWPAATQIDGNAKITDIAAAALPDGTLHVETLVPGSGIWDRVRSASGTWAASTQIDTNGEITAVAAAALPDGTLHVETLVPGSGIWDRVRSASGTWSSASKIDTNGDITAVAAAALSDGTLHIETLVPGSGVWDRVRSASGTWAASTQIDINGEITALAAAGLPDGTLHVETLVPGSGVWDRVRNASGTWAASTQIDTNGEITAVAAAGLPDGSVHVLSVVPGAGLSDQTRGTNGTWSTASAVDRAGGIFAGYAAALPDGTLHAGTAAYPTT